MGIDLSRFKVIHGDKVLNAVTLQCIQLPEGTDFPLKTSVIKPRFLEVLAINEDGNIIVIHDEAWRFQFLPIVHNCGGCKNGSE